LSTAFGNAVPQIAAAKSVL
jgi:hypothetical protein